MRKGTKCWTEHLPQTTYACRGNDRQGEIYPLTVPPLLLGALFYSSARYQLADTTMPFFTTKY